MQERVVGVNQSLREIKNKRADFVYIASDAEKDVVCELEKICNNAEIEIKYIDTMKQLGKMFNIQVKVAAVTILKKEVNN